MLVKWKFPIHGVPPNHPFLNHVSRIFMGFSIINQLFWGHATVVEFTLFRGEGVSSSNYDNYEPHPLWTVVYACLHIPSGIFGVMHIYIYGTLQRFAPISPKQHLEAVSVEATAKADGAKNLEVLVAVPSIVWFSALKYDLVGGLEHVLFFHILGIIIPTDYFFYSEGLKPPTSYEHNMKTIWNMWIVEVPGGSKGLGIVYSFFFFAWP